MREICKKDRTSNWQKSHDCVYKELIYIPQRVEKIIRFNIRSLEWQKQMLTRAEHLKTALENGNYDEMDKKLPALRKQIYRYEQRLYVYYPARIKKFRNQRSTVRYMSSKEDPHRERGVKFVYEKS